MVRKPSKQLSNPGRQRSTRSHSTKIRRLQGPDSFFDLLPEEIRNNSTRETRNYLKRHSSRLISSLSLVKSLSVTSILDVGSGGGTFLSMLPSKWRRVGIDSPSNAKLMVRLGIEGLGMDLEKDAFPLENNSFELVTLLEVIEHVANKAHLLSEIHRVLKKDGHLVMTTPDPMNPFWWLRDHLLEMPGLGKLIFRVRSRRYPDPLDTHKGFLHENQLIDLINAQDFLIAGRHRFQIFQPNDDIVLLCRKRVNA